MVEVFSSSLDATDLENLRKLYSVSKDIVLCSPKAFEQAYQPLVKEICLYEQA